ncbi:MAG: 30S ribosomal protein S20 [Chitinispirillaceae bacterium]|nr:30S ribosomal protein S20 [Chitinispirillaceae bacterium]
MQRHKSAEKATRQSKKMNAINRMQRSRMATAIKIVLGKKEKNDAEEALKTAYSILDKGVKNRLIKANNAANKKARLSKYVNQLS